MVEEKLLVDAVRELRILGDILQMFVDATESGMPEAVADERRLMPETVRAALARKANAGYIAEVKGLIVRYGADRLSGIDPTRYPDLLADVEAL